jgi:hypothetical protein
MLAGALAFRVFQNALAVHKECLITKQTGNLFLKI